MGILSGWLESVEKWSGIPHNHIIIITTSGVTLLLGHRILFGTWIPKPVRISPGRLIDGGSWMVGKFRRTTVPVAVGRVTSLNIHPLIGAQPIQVQSVIVDSFSMREAHIIDSLLLVADLDGNPITSGLESVQVQVSPGSLTLRVPGREPLLVNPSKLILSNTKVDVNLSDGRILTGVDCGFGPAAWMCKVLQRTTRSCKLVCFDYKSLGLLNDRPFHPRVGLVEKCHSTRRSCNILVEQTDFDRPFDFSVISIGEQQVKCHLELNKCCEYIADGDLEFTVRIDDVIYA